MTVEPLRIGTRSSPLARWQAEFVAAQLAPILAPKPVALIPVETDGDRDQSTQLAAMGGFGVFTKAIQQALLDGRVDLAVHSLKDLPTIPVDGLMLAATPKRGPTGDAFVSTKSKRFDDLPRGATIGTGSLRRRAMIANRRPDLRFAELRGNIDTRLKKLETQGLDGIVLAEAALVRLGLAHRITETLDPTWMLPAVGQGAIGLECREADRETRHWVDAVNDRETFLRVSAERAMLATLGGGCLIPLGVSSSIRDDLLTLRAVVHSPDGVRVISATHRGPAHTPLAIGQELAAILREEGADSILSGMSL